MKLVILCLGLFLLTLPALYSSGSDKPVIAVVDFKNISKNKGYDFLEKTVAESLTTSLQKTGKFNIVERQRLMTLMDEKKLELSGLMDTDINQSKKLGLLTEADSLVLGSIASIDDKVEINARVVKVDTGEILLAEKITEKMGEQLFNRLSELGEAIALRLLNDKYGFLTLDSTPQGAEVKIGDQALGRTPIVGRKMKAGKYTVSLMSPGYDVKSMNITIHEDKKSDYNTYLEKKTESLYKYRYGLLSHFYGFLSKDYQIDGAFFFDYNVGDFTFGVEGGGHFFTHSYTDNEAPGKAFEDLMFIPFIRFDAVLKYNLFKDNQIISPYFGGGLGFYTANSKEYDFSRTALYYKGIVGINLFPTSQWSFGLELIYHNMGNLELNEKKFNFFGDFTYTKKQISLENLMAGISIRAGF